MAHETLRTQLRGELLELAFSVAENFGLDRNTAQSIASEVGKAVSDWRTLAAVTGISKSNIERMASAFEHDDLKRALKG